MKEFLAGRAEEQQLKENKNRKESHVHWVVYNPFNRLQSDIQKYESSNHDYIFILCIMDIFSLKVWAYSLITHGLSNTTPAIKKLFSSSGTHEFNKGICHYYE